VIRQLRVRRRIVQTPVIRYRNRKTGRTVTIVATQHVGTSEYFRQLGQIIAELELAGAAVCFEGMWQATQQDWAEASGEERAVRGLPLPGEGFRVQSLCRHLGWIEQSAGLRPSASWRNVDSSDLAVIRHAQPGNIQGMHEEFNDTFAGLSPDQFGVVMGAFLGLQLRLLSWDRWELMRRWATRKVASDAYRNVAQVVIADRNREALARLPSDRDAVLLWGIGHLPGLTAGLKQAGYRRRRARWVPVGEVPAIWPSLRIVVGWLRSPGGVEPDHDDESSVPPPSH
jgi:hypothetical protein